jgi:hypothetical protein
MPYTKTNQMTSAIIEVLNKPEVQEMLKPMFQAAYEQGYIKTQEDAERFKENFVLHLIMSDKRLIRILSDDVYNKINAAA